MTTSSSSFADFVAAQLRVEALGAKLFAAEVESIIAALAGDFVSIGCAIEWAADAGISLTIASSAMAST
jgi:hypothetical protein